MITENKTINIEYFPVMLEVPESDIDIWDKISDCDTNAILVETFGSGSIPSGYIRKIREKIRKGIAVFLINSVENTGNARGEESVGIPKVTYGVQQDALEAGAIHLESVNIGHQKRAYNRESDRKKDNVIETIRELARESRDMFDLIDRVREVYNMTDEEIDFVVEQTQENAAPISKESIIKSREKVDKMLEGLKREMEPKVEGELGRGTRQ